jgi:tetratricopeptide (TPR) repeat protein
MRYILIVLIGALITGCNKGWTPPQNPNPQSILKEAEADAKAGKYEDALAKQIWFFQNALKYDSAEYGVRLSFALSDWVELGKVYPPALEKLKFFRDEAGKNVREGKSVSDNFSDFESINENLKEETKTVDLFIWLDSNKPDLAKTVFDSAQPALIKSKQYTLLGKYIQNPLSLYEEALRSYETNIELAKDPKFGGKIKDFADQKFINDSTTLIALLVITDRKADAEEIVRKIKNQPELPRFDEQIQKALNGEAPPSWP